MRNAKPSEEIIKHKDEILKLIAVLLDDSRFLEVQNEKGGVNNMCEVLDRIEEKGVEKGMAKGMAKGMVIAYNDLNLSVKQIAEKVGISEEEVQSILASQEAE